MEDQAVHGAAMAGPAPHDAVRRHGGGLRERGHGAVDWMDPETLTVLKRVHVETTDRGVVYTNEGMTVRGGTMYLLPEDLEAS